MRPRGVETCRRVAVAPEARIPVLTSYEDEAENGHIAGAC
jgi:hypothetical protein